MALEFAVAVKGLEKRIEILKQNLRFFMANYKAEYTSQIITIKRELDRAVQERMNLSQVYYSPNNNRVAFSAT
jgi:hypothetical protein